MSLTKAELEKIISQLQDIPPPSDEERILSQREVIQRIRPVIKKLRSKGYTPQQIQAILDSSGLEVSRRQIELSTKKKRQSKVQPKQEQSETSNSQQKPPSSNKDVEAGNDSLQQNHSHREVKSETEPKDDKLSPRGNSHFTPDPDREDI
ncbi:hypothetical protein DYI26_19295 [Halomonas litopenaei]|nr:hypothetical protein [Halomonas litopenaei]